MIDPNMLLDNLRDRGIDFYVGVPDSLLGSFCACLEGRSEYRQRHVVAANEGNAIGLAIGHHIGTGKVAVVYMQNSGLGNAVNPLVSIADSRVCKIPMLLIIGWRGQPGVEDEPQHIKQGQITLELLDLLDIPYRIINPESNIDAELDCLFNCISSANTPAALVVSKDSFSHCGYLKSNQMPVDASLTREDAIETILSLTSSKDLIISTTGKASRELHEIRCKNNQQCSDFMMVGGMGHASSVALGVAIEYPEKRVICMDGDGAMLMHLGALSTIGLLKPKNFIHILLNNFAHDSVGGQGTAAVIMNFKELAKAVGYSGYFKAHDARSIELAWDHLDNKAGPSLLEIIVKNGSRKDLGRPSQSAEQNKKAFMVNLGADV